MTEIDLNTAGLTAHPHSASAHLPTVQGRCPACGARSLFLASGGYVTCSILDCADPCKASDLLDSPRYVD